jgi:cytoskeletal protein CcmA (bactofilin family)
MFNSKSKNNFDETPASATSIIGAGTVIAGNIESNGDVRIDGKVIGNVTAKAKILVGPEGVIVNGDIYAGKLQIEPTVTFNGQCHMGANVVALNAELSNAVNQ